jgi:hypothetical protein
MKHFHAVGYVARPPLRWTRGPMQTRTRTFEVGMCDDDRAMAQNAAVKLWKELDRVNGGFFVYIFTWQMPARVLARQEPELVYFTFVYDVASQCATPAWDLEGRVRAPSPITSCTEIGKPAKQIHQCLSGRRTFYCTSHARWIRWSVWGFTAADTVYAAVVGSQDIRMPE